MRWFVEIRPLGTSDIKPVNLCVEATHWQNALRDARHALALSESLEGFSIEVLDDGVDAIGPGESWKQQVRRAPESAPLKRFVHKSSMDAIRSRRSGSPPAPDPAEAPAPDPALAPPSGIPFETLLQREVPPSEKSPITYREYAYAIPTGCSEQDAERFVLERFESIQRELAATDTAKLVNLAAFDHVFQDKPLRPPLVTLAWKDWKGPPDVRYPSRPGASIPPPRLGPPAGQPASSSGDTVSNQAGSKAVSTNVGGDTGASSVETAHKPVPARVAGQEPPASESVQRPSRSALEITRPDRPRKSNALAATLQSSESAEGTDADAEGDLDEPSHTAPTVPPVASTTTDSSSPDGADEASAALLELLQDLDFLRDASEGGDFVVSVALEQMQCTMAIAQIYNTDRHHFVVVAAAGPNVTETIGFETVDRDSLLASTVRRNAPHVVAGKDPRVRTGRWTSLGGIPRSILVCPVLLEDRVLGTLEVAHTNFGSTFGKNDERALTCIARQFAAFLSRVGLQLDGPA